MASNLKDVVNKHLEENLEIKLHLGCGPNLLEGYVNVEGDYLAHMEGIAVHDLTQPFPIPDNTVSEILTVHVIEHIMPHDVPAMLTEWLRILKPGGFVATEWPDLLKMCQVIVDNPHYLYSKNGKELKRSVAGIFGNISRYKDPVMLHKWGYSAESLKRLKLEMGFSRAIIEDNLYRKTRNDSRVVAFK
jgi:predicted SAM-dependent methyltransferase